MKSIVNTKDAPAAIGPYSQAVKIDKFIFTSGQIPLDPSTGEVVASDISQQTKQVLHNLSQVLAAAGSSMDKVIKTTIFLQDMKDFALVNEVYGKFFPEQPPARSTVQVSRLPKDVLVEIEAVAYSE